MSESDFITLACPNCGGKRSVRPGTSTVVCEYCGSEYLVNPDLRAAALESQNACPTCHRNDRVEKVSSILQNQIQIIQGTTIQQQAYMTKKGQVKTKAVETPYNATQATALAQKLNQPPSQSQFSPEPHRPKPFTVEGYKASGRTKKIMGIVIAALLILMGICTAAGNSSSQPSLGGILFLPMIGIVIGGWLWIIGNRQLREVEIPEVVERLERESQARQDAYEKVVDARNKQVAGYQRALENWNNLYYCHRDDCIFVPGSGKTAGVSELQNYLYSA